MQPRRHEAAADWIRKDLAAAPPRAPKSERALYRGSLRRATMLGRRGDWPAPPETINILRQAALAAAAVYRSDNSHRRAGSPHSSTHVRHRRRRECESVVSAKIDMQIFELDRPLRGDHELATAADRPPGSDGAARTPKAESQACTSPTARPPVGKSRGRRAQRQDRSRYPKRKRAVPSAPIQPPQGCGRGRAAGPTSRNVRPRPVALQAVDEPILLPIIADPAAGETAGKRVMAVVNDPLSCWPWLPQPQPPDMPP